MMAGSKNTFPGNPQINLDSFLTWTFQFRLAVKTV